MTRISNSTFSEAPQPVYGGLDALKAPVDTAKNVKKIVAYHREGDNEGVRDHLVLLFQKPISAINTLGNIFLLFREALPFFKSSASYLLPLSQAMGGLGLFLSLTQFFLEMTTLRRVFAFEARFILTSSAPKGSDPEDLRKWAKKTKSVAENLQASDKNEELQKIIDLSQKIIHLSKEETPNTGVLSASKELLILLIQKRDLQTLQRHINETTDERELERLYRRLGVNFTKEAKEKMNDYLRGFERSNMDEIEAAQALLHSMEVQLTKRKIASTLGSLGAILVFAGVTLTLLGLPWIGLPLLIVGSLLGVGRFFFWISFAESKDWKPELGAWVRVHVDAIKRSFLNLFIKLREGTVPEVKHWAGGKYVQEPQSSIPL